MLERGCGGPSSDVSCGAAQEVLVAGLALAAMTKKPRIGNGLAGKDHEKNEHHERGYAVRAVNHEESKNTKLCDGRNRTEVSQGSCDSDFCPRLNDAGAKPVAAESRVASDRSKLRSDVFWNGLVWSGVAARTQHTATSHWHQKDSDAYRTKVGEQPLAIL